MDSNVKYNDQENDEIKKALQSLENHKKKDTGRYWTLAVATLIISAVSIVLYLFCKLDDNRLYMTPIIPMIFGVVGIFRSNSAFGKVISGLCAFLGFLIFVVFMLFS